MKTHKGFFISFEKTKEGLGGSTQAQLLTENLSKLGYDVILTREPGGTRLGQELRRLLLDAKAHDTELSKATELFLFMADRAQHYKEVIKPALKEGKIVVCDRYMDSTLVYQGGARGWKNAFLWRLHHATTGSLVPDLTFVLHGTPHRERSKDDRFEGQTDAFHKLVEERMTHIATKNNGNRYVMVEGNRPIEDIGSELLHTTMVRMSMKVLPNPS